MKEVTREKDNSQMVVTGDEPMGNAEEVGRQRARSRRKPDNNNNQKVVIKGEQVGGNKKWRENARRTI